MRSRRLIIVLTILLYALQVSAIFMSGSAGTRSDWLSSIQASLLVSVAIALVDFAVVHYLLAAVKRSEAAYASNVSGRLEQSLERYRVESEQDEVSVREAGRAIEHELNEARQALQRGDVSMISPHLHASLDLASQTKTVACECIPVAAVLASKARSCAEANVTLNAQVVLPVEMPIDDIELASVFFNLIDNALHECVALAQEEDTLEPTITVRANTLAGQVFVEVSNPCRSGAEGKLREAGKRADSTRAHGWGVDIVQNVARKYHGIASFTESSKVFTAQVMLPLSSPEQAAGAGASL